MKHDDVAIIGSGIGGFSLAAVLARQTGDYSGAAFMPLEEMTLRYMRMHDQLVAGEISGIIGVRSLQKSAW